MALATLQFTLPDEAIDHDQAVHAQALVNMLAEFREWLRRKQKYERLSDEALVVVEEVWKRLHEGLVDHGVEKFVF